MVKVIGVRFRTAGKIYYFDPLEFDIQKNDHVIVETARGIEYGTVVGNARMVEEDEVILPLKPVLRIATERDTAQEADNKRREKEAYAICLNKIREHGLEMKLIDAEYTFDNNKVLFYFTADGRIDFRELVKDLASIFKTRIELRQIGVRDETKIVGGIGICGRPLCCHSYLSDFIPVSIKMAKEQNLSLNPTKISGVCGRLMCCLKHEEDTYEELNRSLPHVGDRVVGPDGIQGEVSSVNVLRQLVKVVIEDGDAKEIQEFKAEELKSVRRGNRRVKEEVSAEELRALEMLEKQDRMENEENEDRKPSASVRTDKQERSENPEDTRRHAREENRRSGREDTREDKRRERREDLRAKRGEGTSEESGKSFSKENRRKDREGRKERTEITEENRKNTREEGRRIGREENREENRRGSREENRENRRRDRREYQEQKRQENKDGQEIRESYKEDKEQENRERRNRRGQNRNNDAKERPAQDTQAVKREEHTENAQGTDRPEKKRRFDRKRKGSGENPEPAEKKSFTDRTFTDQPKEESFSGNRSEIKAGNTLTDPQNGEQKDGAGRPNKKKYFNRNRRRNKPEGADEQHES